MIQDKIFQGKAISIDQTDSITIKCYDVLTQLQRENIPSKEGKYYGMDAGAIIKDILYNSGNNPSSIGTSLDTKLLVSEIDLIDKTRLEAIQLLLTMINGAAEDKVFFMYSKNNDVIISPLPEFDGDSVIELTDSNIKRMTKKINGANYFNCATVIGTDCRGYYPCKVNSDGSMMPDFPTGVRFHKLINEYKDNLTGTAQTYYIARGFVRTRKIIQPELNVTIMPERFDIIPGFPLHISSEKYGVDGRFRISEVSWSYSKGSKEMSLNISEYKSQSLADLIKIFK